MSSGVQGPTHQSRSFFEGTNRLHDHTEREPKERRSFEDRLMPRPTRPSMRYVEHDENDQLMWKAKVKCFHDEASPLSHTTRHQGHGLQEAPYNSLDLMIANVWSRRNRPLISCKEFDGEPEKNQKYYIAHSATNHYDIVASIEPGKDLVQRLQKKKYTSYR
jgi:hypothetical protein